MPSLPSAGSGERAPLGHSSAHWVAVSVQEGEQALPQAPAGGRVWEWTQVPGEAAVLT